MNYPNYMPTVSGPQPQMNPLQYYQQLSQIPQQMQQPNVAQHQAGLAQAAFGPAMQMLGFGQPMQVPQMQQQPQQGGQQQMGMGQTLMKALFR